MILLHPVAAQSNPRVLAHRVGATAAQGSAGFRLGLTQQGRALPHHALIEQTLHQHQANATACQLFAGTSRVPFWLELTITFPLPL